MSGLWRLLGPIIVRNVFSQCRVKVFGSSEGETEGAVLRAGCRSMCLTVCEMNLIHHSLAAAHHSVVLSVFGGR